MLFRHAVPNRLKDSVSEKENKKQAQKLLDFENTIYSCTQLAKMYLKSEPIQHDSWNNVVWFNVLEARFIELGCVDPVKLDNLEFIKMCMDSHLTRCELSKLKNPELYENFDYLTEFKALQTEVNPINRDDVE
jgi:hypothetical protein